MTTPTPPKTRVPASYNPFSAGWQAFAAASGQMQAMTRVAAGAMQLASTQAMSGSTPKTDAKDPLNLNPAMARLAGSAIANPAHVLNAQAALATDMTLLWRRAMEKAMGVDVEPVAAPEEGDRRFGHADWSEQPGYDLMKQGYLLGARAAQAFIADAPGLDERERAKLAFVTAQITDAASPTNFLATNPAALRRAVETGGQSALEGMAKLLEDLDKSGGKLRPRMTDEGSFEVGKTLATTEGKVVYQNDLIQLIQYAPLTPKVHKRPLLVMPPWMNKYYVLDLRPENSLLRFMVEQGHTVFVISWVNPDESHANKGFEDYMLEGPLAALDAIEQATGEKEVNVAGYCLGGILLAATCAWLAARGDTRVNSATLMTTMVDFGDIGDISLFIDDEALPKLEDQINGNGLLSGRAVADTWRAVRANDLIWSFYVHEYLMGESTRPWDVLAWNDDNTNMPAAMHTFFMRNMYLKNRLREPGALTLAGESIDVTQVKTPTYVLSAVEDHIAPWETTYETTQLFSGPVRFVLGGSGHIAGVVNPPTKEKYGYRVAASNPETPDEWQAIAKEHAGSWWLDWSRWLKRHGGAQVPARTPGKGKLKAIEDAPGSYVMKRIA